MPEDFALELFRSIRWADGIHCPKCKSFEIQKVDSRAILIDTLAGKCRNNFSDFTNTRRNPVKYLLAKYYT